MTTTQWAWLAAFLLIWLPLTLKALNQWQQTAAAPAPSGKPSKTRYTPPPNKPATQPAASAANPLTSPSPTATPEPAESTPTAKASTTSPASPTVANSTTEPTSNSHTSIANTNKEGRYVPDNQEPTDQDNEDADAEPTAEPGDHTHHYTKTVLGAERGQPNIACDHPGCKARGYKS